MIDKLKLNKNMWKNVCRFLSSLTENPSISISDPIFRAFTGAKGAFAGCPCGTYSFRIQSNGEVTPCIYLKESGGNIKEKSVEEIMNSPIFEAIRSRIPSGKCISCPVYQYCKGGCAGASYLEYGDFNHPDPLCWLTPKETKPPISMKIPDKWNVHELYLCTIYVPIK
jgi:radical SAM protein with 4Fe4S-binding SPASM domain